MAESIEVPEVLGPRLAALRAELSSKWLLDDDQKALLEELNVLSRTAWLITPAASVADLELGSLHNLETRVSSGQGGPVGVKCSNKDCPYAGP